MKMLQKMENSSVVCEHGIERLKFCENCLQASKNLTPWEIIRKLQKEGFLYKPEDPSVIEYEFRINPKLDKENRFEGQVFNIHQIRSPEDPELDKVLTFLGEQFNDDVLNTKEDFKRKLTGRTRYGKERPAYRCFYVTNQTNDIIAVRVSEQIPLLKEGVEKKDSNIFYAIYIVLDKDYRGGNNIPIEMYTASLMDAAEISHKTGKKVDFLIAECSSATEKLQNKIGLKRIYLKGDKDDLTEIEFFQPPMEFDKNTGKATSSESAEHFMLMKTNTSEQVNRNDVYDSIASLFNQYRSNHPIEYFEGNEAAFNVHEQLFAEKLKQIKKQLDSCSEIVLLSKAERDEQIKNNTSIFNFEAADSKGEY